EIYRVNKLKAGSGKVVLRRIIDGKKVRMDDKDLKNAEVLGGSELIKKSVVVSKSENEMKLLDPESYDTVTVLKPEGFETDEKEVEVIKVRGHLYILRG
ncbi:MAG: hypothetical protein ACOC53_06660, partial [Candidatus Saliniplasma sp.]